MWLTWKPPLRSRTDQLPMNWADPKWFSRWADLNRKQPEAEQRKVVNEMLKVFYEESPWLLLYFQPDFYGVSNRLDYRARGDEYVYAWDMKLR